MTKKIEFEKNINNDDEEISFAVKILLSLHQSKPIPKMNTHNEKNFKIKNAKSKPPIAILSKYKKYLFVCRKKKKGRKPILEKRSCFECGAKKTGSWRRLYYHDINGNKTKKFEIGCNACGLRDRKKPFLYEKKTKIILN